MKIKLTPMITSPVDFLKNPSPLSLYFTDPDSVQYAPTNYIPLKSVEIELDGVDNEVLTKIALEHIEAAEEKVRAELQEKLFKLQEEKQNLLALTFKGDL